MIHRPCSSPVQGTGSTLSGDLAPTMSVPVAGDRILGDREDFHQEVSILVWKPPVGVTVGAETWCEERMEVVGKKYYDA